MVRRLVLALCLFACTQEGADATRPVQSALAGGDGHVLVAIAIGDGAPRVLSATRVDGPLPVDRGGGPEPWRVQVDDAGGALLADRAVPAAGLLRGEAPRPDGTVEHVRFEGRPGVVTVRLPRLPRAARLRLLVPEQTHGRLGAAKPGTGFRVLADLRAPEVLR